MTKLLRAFRRQIEPVRLRETLRNYGLLTLGALVMVANFNLFLAPADVAPGGVSGTTLIINHYTGLPNGLVMLALSIPLLILGFRQLGRFRFLVRTLYTTLIYTLGVDLTAPLFPAGGIVDDLLLTALYGGVIGGIGYGLIVRGRGMTAGTGIISRVIQLRTGIPISQLYILIDGAVILLMGLTFGWPNALYAAIMLFIWGLATDYVLEGPSVVRMVFIITDRPEAVGEILMTRMGVGVTRWAGEGMYSGTPHSVLFCTVNRPDVELLRIAVLEIDAEAFIVIGQGHQATGGVLRGGPDPTAVRGDAQQEAGRE